MNDKYDAILADISIYSLASSDFSAFEYLMASGSFKERFKQLVSNKSQLDFDECLNFIYMKQSPEHKIDAKQFDAIIRNIFDDGDDMMGKMNLLIMGEDDDAVKLINETAQSLIAKTVGKNKDSKDFYEYFIQYFTMEPNADLTRMVFDTMSDELKNDPSFAREIVIKSDAIVKSYKYEYLDKLYPNIFSYPDALLSFDDSIIKDPKFIHFALNHDHMSLYAESLYENAEVYSDVIQNFNSSIDYNINEYAGKCGKSLELVKSKMYKA